MRAQLLDDNPIVKENLKSKDKILINSARLISLCLVGGFFAHFSFRSLILQEILFIALIAPALLLIRYRRTHIRSVHRCFGFSLFYLIPVLLSFLLKHVFSDNNTIDEIVIVINLFYGFYVAAVFANTKPYDLMPYILKYVFIFSLPLIIYVLITQRDAYIWGRWAPYDLQPNWWGMMILGVAWGSTSLNNIYLRITIIMIALLFMIELQSRGSIVALMPVLILSCGLFFPLTYKRLYWLFTTFIIILISIVFSEVIFDKGIITYAIDYILNSVLLINDPLRGMGSGLTGRAEGFLIAWNDFLNSPLFGNGFGEYDFVHNGFLLTLAETGLLGLTGMMVIIVRSLRGMLKQRNWIQLGLLLSYIAAIMTFPRSFNINMTGFLFIILVMKCQYIIQKRPNVELDESLIGR